MPKITHTEIRMYRMGTGDCFILKFFAAEKLKTKMMIDCGTWSGTKEHLTPYIQDLKTYVDNHIDVLVITHEHKDHVHLFDICEELLTTNFTVDKIWMGWTEKDAAKNVKQWQKDYGDKKKALALAASWLKTEVNKNEYVQQMNNEYAGSERLAVKQSFADTVSNFNLLQSDQLNAAGQYVEGLAGMKVVKDTIAKDNIEYYSPGDIIENIPHLEGIKFYVLGPPLSWEEVKVEEGGKGESYDHNKELKESDAFAAAILSIADKNNEDVLPFDKQYEILIKDEPIAQKNDLLAPKDDIITRLYKASGNEWRNIDNDWLNSAGSLALRINSITNNLSLALAIEYEDSGKVMLFPGDAEYGSWASWHTINWSVPSRNKKVHLTEDLLNRTVFYKVAHHLSHHGTAERLGMEMMTHPELSAMATLDYSAISPQWKGTMPNRALLKALVTQTKGRLMVMNTNQLFYDKANTVDLRNRILQERKKMTSKEIQEFTNSYREENLYLHFTVKD